MLVHYRLRAFLQWLVQKYRHIWWLLLRIIQKASSRASTLTHQPQEAQLDDKHELVDTYKNYLTSTEANQIREQFHKADNGRRLLFWTNVPRGLAQAWADANGANTLTTMMGPLMDEVHLHKKGSQWSRYVKGISCLFAELARQKFSVLVLTTAPGVKRFRKESTFKSLEEPILKSTVKGLQQLQIDYVHPTVCHAEAAEYTLWPEDRSFVWTKRFGAMPQVDAATLWKRVQKGTAGPYFGLNRLPPLLLANTMQVRSPINIGVGKVALFPRLDDCRKMIPAGRHILNNTSAYMDHACTPVRENVQLNPLMSGQLPERATKSDKADLSSLQPSNRSNGELHPIQEADVQKALKCTSTADLCNRLVSYPSILDRHRGKSKKIVTYQVTKVNELYRAVLSYGDLRFSSLASTRKIARRLAAKQACDRLGLR